MDTIKLIKKHLEAELNDEWNIKCFNMGDHWHIARFELAEELLKIIKENGEISE